MDLIDHYGISNCNQSPRATPFHKGFAVDTIPASTLPAHQQVPLNATRSLLVRSSGFPFPLVRTSQQLSHY